MTIIIQADDPDLGVVTETRLLAASAIQLAKRWATRTGLQNIRIIRDGLVFTPEEFQRRHIVERGLDRLAFSGAQTRSDATSDGAPRQEAALRYGGASQQNGTCDNDAR